MTTMDSPTKSANDNSQQRRMTNAPKKHPAHKAQSVRLTNIKPETAIP
jgi:hypothetical protein